MTLNHNRTARGFRLSLIALIPLLLSGCYSSALHGKPFFNQASFRANPPRTLAILPTTDDSGHPELAPMMRKALLSAIVPLAYEDKEIRDVDEFLASMAAKSGVAPEKLTPEVTTNSKLADCVLYSRITNVSRFFALLYAHYRFDLDLVMIDTRNRQVIYRNHFIFYDRLGTPTYVALPAYSLFAFVGLAGSSVESLMHLRPGRLEETFEEGAKKIAEELPVPSDLETTKDGGIRLVSMQVVHPFESLGPGERVIVKAQATPGCKAAFDLGQLALNIPMQENTPGSYIGMYEIKPGDNADYVLVELHLERGADKLEHANKADAFSVDTTPPPRARIASFATPWVRSGIVLHFELDPAQAAQARDKQLEYHVYRKEPAGKKFERIGVSHKPTFRDESPRLGQTEEYYVITKDGAGNLSPMGEVKRIKVG